MKTICRFIGVFDLLSKSHARGHVQLSSFSTDGHSVLDILAVKQLGSQYNSYKSLRMKFLFASTEKLRTNTFF